MKKDKFIQEAQLLRKHTRKTWSPFSERSSRGLGGKVDCILIDEEDIEVEIEFKRYIRTSGPA